MSETPSRYLIVEDDPNLNQALAQNFQKKGKVDQVTTLAGAFRFVAEYERGYDVVVLDRTLPDGDGLELVPFLKKDFPQTTVCVLSGLTLEKEQVNGLREGADLYLCKPLSARVVGEHISAVRRPHLAQTQKVLAWKDLKLQAQNNSVAREDQQVLLTKRETQFLSSFLQSHLGEATHDQLLKHFWPRTAELSSGAVHVTVQRLRKKLKQLGVTIKVQYGAGYQLQTNKSL